MIRDNGKFILMNSAPGFLQQLTGCFLIPFCMLIFGRTIAEGKSAAVQGATVTVIDANGNSTGIQQHTDSTGNFRIDSPAIALGATVLFTHPDYFNNEIPVPATGSFGFVVLKAKPVQQPGPLEDIPTIPENTQSMPAWLWFVIVGGLLFAFSKDKKVHRQKKRLRNY